MKTFEFDVMLDDRYVCTMSYRYNPAFPVEDRELVEYVLSKRPSLRGKNFRIAF